MTNIDANWVLVYLGLGAILIELFVGVHTGFDLVLLGVSMIVGGVFGNFFHSFQLGLITASILAFLYIFLGRKIIKQHLNITTTKTNIESLIGKSALVIKPITPISCGQVKIFGEIWRAEAEEEIKTGEKVKIVAVEGVTLKVIKASKKA